MGSPSALVSGTVVAVSPSLCHHPARAVLWDDALPVRSHDSATPLAKECFQVALFRAMLSPLVPMALSCVTARPKGCFEVVLSLYVHVPVPPGPLAHPRAPLPP